VELSTSESEIPGFGGFEMAAIHDAFAHTLDKIWALYSLGTRH